MPREKKHKSLVTNGIRVSQAIKRLHGSFINVVMGKLIVALAETRTRK
jgi:hypothetical protein